MVYLPGKKTAHEFRKLGFYACKEVPFDCPTELTLIRPKYPLFELLIFTPKTYT